MDQFKKIIMISLVTEEIGKIKSNLSLAIAQRKKAIIELEKKSGIDKKTLDSFVDNDSKGYQLMHWQNNIMNSVLKARNALPTSQMYANPNQKNTNVSTTSNTSVSTTSNTNVTSNLNTFSSPIISTNVTHDTSSHNIKVHSSSKSTITVTKLSTLIDNQSTPVNSLKRTASTGILDF